MGEKQKTGAEAEGLLAKTDRIDARLIARFGATMNPTPQARRVDTAPGIGPITAATLVADLPELGQLNRREIASFTEARSQFVQAVARSWQLDLGSDDWLTLLGYPPVN